MTPEVADHVTKVITAIDAALVWISYLPPAAENEAAVEALQVALEDLNALSEE